MGRQCAVWKHHDSKPYQGHMTHFEQQAVDAPAPNSCHDWQSVNAATYCQCFQIRSEFGLCLSAGFTIVDVLALGTMGHVIAVGIVLSLRVRDSLYDCRFPYMDPSMHAVWRCVHHSFKPCTWNLQNTRNAAHLVVMLSPPNIFVAVSPPDCMQPRVQFARCW